MEIRTDEPVVAAPRSGKRIREIEQQRLGLVSLTVSSPIGDIVLGAQRGALVELDLPPATTSVRTARRHAATATSSQRTRSAHAPQATDVLELARRQLEEYFAGERRDFALPLRLEGTAFQRSVWDVLRGIPYGETMSYRDVARRVGRPAAARAVGRAVGQNPLSIVVPCHRVIGADGGLTGFGGGLERKRYLLALETAAPHAHTAR